MKKIMTAALCAALLLSGCGQQQDEDTVAVNEKNYPIVSVSPSLESAAQYLTQAVLSCSADEALEHILVSDNTKQAGQALLDGDSELLIAYQSELGDDVQWTPLGTDALVFAADPDCETDGLTTQQLKGIYGGTITNWAQAGGSDEEIVIRHRAEGSASRSALERTVKVTAAEGDEDARSGCLYYMTYSEYQTAAEDSLKLLSVDGVLPEEEGYAFQMPYGAAVLRDAEKNAPERIVFRWIASVYSSGEFPNTEQGTVHLGE